MGDTWIYGFKCERCGHEWPRKKDPTSPNGYKDPPVICAKCRSAYWNKPRQKPQTDVVQQQPPSENIPLQDNTPSETASN